jgi:hypothetical protein
VDLVVKAVQQVHQDPLVVLGNRVQLDQVDHRVKQEERVLLVVQVLLGKPVLLVLQVLLDKPGEQVLLGLAGLLDKQEVLDLLVHQEHLRLQLYQRILIPNKLLGVRFTILIMVLEE